MLLRIAIVTEANYRDLTKLCEKNAAGKDYADFLRIVDETFENAKKLGVQAVRVPIDPPKLAEWLGDRKATRLDLMQFADKIHRAPFYGRQLENHDADAAPRNEKERRISIRRNV